MRSLLLQHHSRAPDSADPGPVRAAERQLEPQRRSEVQPQRHGPTSAPAPRVIDSAPPLTRQQAVTTLVQATLSRRAAMERSQTPVTASLENGPPPPVGDQTQSQVQPQTQPQTHQSSASHIIQFPETDHSQFQLQTRSRIQAPQPQSQPQFRPQVQFEGTVDQPQLEHCEDAQQNPEPVIQAAPQTTTIRHMPLTQFGRTHLHNIQEEDTEPLTIDEVIHGVDPSNTGSGVDQASPTAAPPPAYSEQQATTPLLPSTPTSVTRAAGTTTIDQAVGIGGREEQASPGASPVEVQAHDQGPTQSLSYTGQQIIDNTMTFEEIGDMLIGDANRFAGEELGSSSNSRNDGTLIFSSVFDPEHEYEHNRFHAARAPRLKVRVRSVSEFDSDDENANGGRISPQSVPAGTQGQPQTEQQAETGRLSRRISAGISSLLSFVSGSSDNREYHERGRSDGTITSSIIIDTTPRVDTDGLEEPQEQARDQSRQETQQETGQEVHQETSGEEQSRGQALEALTLSRILHLSNQPRA